MSPDSKYSVSKHNHPFPINPYKSLKTTPKTEINQEAWETLHGDISRPFFKPETDRIAVKVINHLADEVIKVIKIA